MNKKLTELSNWLKFNAIDFAFINSISNVFYFSGYYSDPHERLLGILVFQDVEPVIICPRLEVMEVENSNWKHDIISYSDNQDPWKKINTFITGKLNKKKFLFGVETNSIPYERAERLKYISQNTQLYSIDNKIDEMRTIKNEIELKYMKESVKLAEFSIKSGLQVIREGCTEQEVSAYIEYEQMKNGIERKATRPLVLFGEHSSLPHGTSGQRKLKKGDVILIDLGVKYKGYCSDMTRSFVFGTDRHNEEIKKIYDTVLKANLTAIEHCQVGKKIGDIDEIARSIITDAGYGSYYPHRIGHGIGVEGHEPPSMNKLNDNLLKEGMTFTIEPGIYIPTIGGIRIEDEVFIGKEGPQVLTSLPKEYKIIN